VKTFLYIILLSVYLVGLNAQTVELVKCQPTGARKVVLLQRIHGTIYNVRVSWKDELKKETRNGCLLILSSTDLVNWNVEKQFRFGHGYIPNVVSQCNYVDYGLFVEDHYPMPKTVCFYYTAKVVFD
jgi:hypothetical protein